MVGEKSIDGKKRISEHLLESEIVCRCCGSGTITPEAADMFERIRAACSKKLGMDCPINITSGYRCQKHNMEVSDTGPDGPHTKGIALDMAVPKGLTFDEFLSIVDEENPDGGVGGYRTKGFVHSDCRHGSARWGDLALERRMQMAKAKAKKAAPKPKGKGKTKCKK